MSCNSRTVNKQTDYFQAFISPKGIFISSRTRNLGSVWSRGPWSSSWLTSSLAGSAGWWASPHWETRRWCPVLAGFLGPVPDNLRVDCARDAVVELRVQFRQLVAWVDRSLWDVSDRGGFDNVADDELADGLVLGAGSGAVGAADVLDVSAPVLGATSVSIYVF